MSGSLQPARRRYLRGSLALGLLGGLAGRALAGLAPQRTWHGLAFGTRVSITIAGAEPARAAAAARAALAEVAAIEAATNLHAPGSALARLNRDGHLDAGGRHLTALMQRACRFGALSEGAFDVTVQPLWLRHFAASVRGVELDAAQIEAARELIDWRAIRVAPDGTLRFDRAGMQATLNGLVQGYASDRAFAVLREHGIDHALIDAGEYRAIGQAAPGTSWRIGVRRPGPHAAALAGVVSLRDAALASSGNDGFHFTADRRLHHILDPRSGVSPGELAGVTVLAADACSADALSTACMVLGVERGRALVESVAGAMALFQRCDGQLLRTRGWPQPVG